MLNILSKRGDAKLIIFIEKIGELLMVSVIVSDLSLPRE